MMFDLQLFGGGGKGGQQFNAADQDYQSEASNANQLMQQFSSLYLPQLKQLLPELASTVNGGNTAMTQAAQAPVNAQTGRALNTIQGSAGGVANPAALYEDISLNGQQQAGLAGDQNIGSALSALQNLIGMGYGGVSTGQQSLGQAGGGEANLGSTIAQNANAPWEALLGAAGQYAAMSAGLPPGAAGGGSSPVFTGNPATTSTEQQFSTPAATAYNNLANPVGTTSFGTTGLGGNSGPISTYGNSSYVPPMYTGV